MQAVSALMARTREVPTLSTASCTLNQRSLMSRIVLRARRPPSIPSAGGQDVTWSQRIGWPTSAVTSTMAMNLAEAIMAGIIFGERIGQECDRLARSSRGMGEISVKKSRQGKDHGSDRHE